MIRYVCYDKNGNIVKQSKHVPHSHMNTDFQMRAIAENYGYQLVGDDVTMTVSIKTRRIEWVEDNGNYHVVIHRLDRKITYIEVTFKNGWMGIALRRGTEKRRLHKTKVESYAAHCLFDLIRKWVDVGRMRVIPDESGIGIVVVPENEPWR